ncbi:MAG: lycopene cyclase domain-containing protein [Clostridiales bacterium]
MSTYFFVHISIVTIPLLFSFDKRVHFYKKWKFALPAILIPGFVFVVWDIIFTSLEVWSFNDSHLSGIHMVNLPIEEVLFFFTVPYASLFTYETLKTYWPEINPVKVSKIFTLLISFLLITIAVFSLGKIYTSITFLSLSLMLLFFQFVVKSAVMGRFYIAYLIIIFPFTFFNGILTGSIIESPVVLYNNFENLGIRIFTIPVEDVFYGMLLILLNISLFEAFRKNLRLKFISNS